MSPCIFGATIFAYVFKRFIGKRENMTIGDPPINPLLGTKVVVNSSVVLIYVPARTVACDIVSVRVVHLIRHREVRQKSHRGRIESSRIDHVRHAIERELRPTRRGAGGTARTGS